MQRDSLPCVLVPYPGHLSPHGGTAPLVHGDSSSKPSTFHEGQKLKLNHCMSSMSNHLQAVSSCGGGYRTTRPHRMGNFPTCPTRRGVQGRPRAVEISP